MRLILASASPRRRQLLTEAGYSIEVDPSGVEELEPEGPVDPAAYVAELAWRKAHAVASRRGSGLVLAADTTCALDGRLLNKPTDRRDADRMIRAQEGREVAILTGLCLYRADRREWIGAVETSVVLVREMTEDERIAHLDSGNWEGKAGAYGVQDDDPIVSVTSGSWSNVVGLPLERLEQLMRDHPSILADR
ncbi:nucleoside triphosphate pyrophosphatase [Tautonia sp. JC769]|uniref:Maf family protein n=1 Tax=Tautonia sp. JC769 TaxID=3232135 RepID=UPI003457B594